MHILPLFYLLNPWHHVSIVSLVCHVFELLLLVITVNRFDNQPLEINVFQATF